MDSKSQWEGKSLQPFFVILHRNNKVVQCVSEVEV